MSALRAAARVKPVASYEGRASRRLMPRSPRSTPSASLCSAATTCSTPRCAAQARCASATRQISRLRRRSGPRVGGRRLAIVSNAGGPGALAADHVGATLAAGSAADRGHLGNAWCSLPSSDPCGNPVYVRADVRILRTRQAAAHRPSTTRMMRLLAIPTRRILMSEPETTAQAPGRPRRGTASRCSPAGWRAGSLRAVTSSPRNTAPSYATPEFAVDAIGWRSRCTSAKPERRSCCRCRSRSSRVRCRTARPRDHRRVACGRTGVARSGGVEGRARGFGVPVLRGPSRIPRPKRRGVARKAGFPWR